MDFSLTKENISNIVSICDSNISQNIDSDITLPEYVDDIETVLNCSMTGEIDSVALGDGKVTVEGHALIRLVYISKNGSLHCFESAVPFSRFADTPNITAEDCLSINALAQYVNCRLVNPRRFDIHGNVTVSVRASKLSNQEIISSAEGAGIQIRTETAEISNACSVNEKAFTLSEMLEISPDLPSIAQIINISASPCISDTKLISQKALVKGDMTLDILYLADEKQEKICSASFSLPISQIIEADGCDESCMCLTCATVSAVNYTVRADSGGAIRLVDVSVGARAKISVYKNEEICIVTDAYSTEYEIECERKNVELKLVREQFTDTCLCRCGFSSPGKEISDVVSLVTKDITSHATTRENKLIISGTVRAGMIIEYSDGEKGYVEKQLEYEYSRDENCKNVICEKSVRVNASSFLLTSSTNVDIRVEMEIEGCIFETQRVSPVNNICIKDDCKKPPCRAALTLYYPDRNEAAWDIAKKYNTTVSAIVDENKLENGVIEAGSMLLIPRM